MKSEPRMELQRISKDAQRAFVAISELLDRDPINRERALRAFEKTVAKGRPDLGKVFFGTIDVAVQQKIRQVCAPFNVVLG